MNRGLSKVLISVANADIANDLAKALANLARGELLIPDFRDEMSTDGLADFNLSAERKGGSGFFHELSIGQNRLWAKGG